MPHPASLDDRALLLTLEECSHLVAHSHDPHETLENIVRLIRDRFQTAVCSVYLLEPETHELVLGATVGLKPESVGRIRMRVDEGLTGLVAERVAPVMVEDAFKHPRFKYFPDAGEDPYRSFLGVPLIEGGALEGVLVIQTVQPRVFSPSEVRMLVTLAAQVASLVGDARLLEKVIAVAHAPQPTQPQPTVQDSSVTGVALSPGSGLGRAYVVDGFEEWRSTVALRSNAAAQERQRINQAMLAAREELVRLAQRISALVGEEHGAILQAQLMIMQDRAIEQDLNDCLAVGASAEGAVFQTLDKYVAAFQKLSTPYFQERIYDIKDVFHRLLWHLRAENASEAAGSREAVVLLAHEASVMELFAVELERLAGVVVEHGGPQSHAAILARSLGIPMVGQVRNLASLMRPGLRLFVDGTAGKVYLDPAADFVAPRKEEPADEREAPASADNGLPRVEVNINLLCEAEPACRQGAVGVGLYRSEFLFLARRTLPSEQEQVGIYRKLLLALDGRPVSIRTFDLRPDKLMAYSHMTSTAARPFDWRLVLESPALQQLFREQVRAIFRAAAPGVEDGRTIGQVRILIPLVTRSELLDFVRATIEQVRAELTAEGLPFAPQVPLGVMIEVAAAVSLVGDWAPMVDYFALGTNDLTASALGIDRDDPVAAGQNDPLHPGMLRLIHEVVRHAHQAHRPVTVCGEMAADPQGCLALIALEVDTLSVPVAQLRSVRRLLAQLSREHALDLAPEMLRQKTAESVRAFLRKWSD